MEALDALTETRYHLRLMPSPTTLQDALDGAGYRRTDARRAIAGLIERRDGHFTAADLVADARASRLRIGRATIFRTLDVLADLHVVERLDLPTGEHAYVACEPAHHHHVVCSSCGRTQDIDDAGWRAVLADIERRTGFRIDDHRLELFGRCPACQASGADADTAVEP
jgi:Fur family ferric uptake transcriptional regulator